MQIFGVKYIIHSSSVFLRTNKEMCVVKKRFLSNLHVMSFAVVVNSLSKHYLPLCFSTSAMHLENIHSGCVVGRVNPSQTNTGRGQRSPNTQVLLTPVDHGTARLMHLSETGSGKRHRLSSSSKVR